MVPKRALPLISLNGIFQANFVKWKAERNRRIEEKDTLKIFSYHILIPTPFIQLLTAI